MASDRHSVAARHRRRLGRAAALAAGLHAVALGAYLATVPAAAPSPVEEIAVDTLDDTAVRAVEDLAPLPDRPASVPAVPVATPVVEQVGDGQTPTGPTRFIAEDDANPAVEHRRLHPTPLVDQAGPPGRLAEAGGPQRAAGHSVPRAEAAEEGTAHPMRQPGDQGGEALPAPAEPGGELPRGAGAGVATVHPAPAPRPDPTPAAPAVRAADPLPARTTGGQAVEDIALAGPGDTAMVRARRSALAAFIVDVQHRVRDHWNPKEVYQRADPTLRSVNVGARRTELELRVSAAGNLESARVASGSGIAELDEEALAACERAQPFAHPPPEVLDRSGRLSFTFGFELDMAEAAYRADLSRALRDRWRPSPAYRVFNGVDRATTVRVLLTFDGVLVHASVLASSGLEILDKTVLAALKQGMQLPAPPATLGEVAGLVPVRLVFLHSARGLNDVKVVRDVQQ
jgi:TonB family protein